MESNKGQRLCGKVSIVTGGGKGIGRAISMEFAREGASVAVLANEDLASAEETAAAIVAEGGTAAAFCCDITRLASVEAMVTKVSTWSGRIDIVVNNAGKGIKGRLERLSESDWDRVFEINAKGAFLVGSAVARQFISRGKGGVIINIAGASAHRAYPGNGAYGPAKAAVVNLTTQMALEWAAFGIRANAISPGPIREPGSDWEQTEPTLVQQVQRLPLKRPGTPRDIARAAVYLASSDADFVTGQTLIVDGGGVATWYLTD
jgi:NAD(P)-dependent dehydrogenase (short-subunit alcohol dehydrogenase family)